MGGRKRTTGRVDLSWRITEGRDVIERLAALQWSKKLKNKIFFTKHDVFERTMLCLVN